ncbi:MAG: PGF-pre-PGF domain-containing protein [Candidatus Bathyarchaeia archaeon]
MALKLRGDNLNIVVAVPLLIITVLSVAAAWASPVWAQVEQIKTDRAIYPPGDSVTISGVASRNAYVAIQVTDPNGTVIWLVTAEPGAGGAYQRHFKLPQNAVEGVYTVVASQGGVVKTATFQVSEEAPQVATSRGRAYIVVPRVIAGGRADVTITKTEDLAVRSIIISVINNVNNIAINITKLPDKPASVTVNVTGKVYHYISIDKTNIGDTDISNATIGFGVEKSWMTANQIHRSTITLQRYQVTGWSSLPTTEVEEDADTVYYEAKSPGLSIFAVTGQTAKTPTSISLSASATSIKRGESITLTGAITPPIGGATVKLTYTKAGAVSVERTATTAVDGSFSSTYTPDAGGSWSVVASWAGDETYLGATSSDVSFNVVDTGCLIATATYGSELAPEVQFLRGFRERTVYATYAGAQFMTVFNGWYYSFSPYVADSIVASPQIKMLLKGIIYPLLGILHLAVNVGSLFNVNNEVSVVVTGIIASALIGVVYFAPAVAVLLYGLKRKLRYTPRISNLRLLSIPWLGSLISILLGELSASSLLMMVGTSILVVSTIALAAGAIAIKAVQIVKR